MSQKKLGLTFYAKGVYKTPEGHLRYSSPKELRGKYVHRHVVDELLKDTPYSVLLLLPHPFEVHHMDYDKTHNCPRNLLLVSESFHTAMNSDHLNGRRKYHGRCAAPPPWLPLLDEEPPF